MPLKEELRVFSNGVEATARRRRAPSFRRRRSRGLNFNNGSMMMLRSDQRVRRRRRLGRLATTTGAPLSGDGHSRITRWRRRASSLLKEVWNRK